VIVSPLKIKAMKTLQNKIGKMTKRIAASLILLAGFVFMSGCQKEDLAANNSGDNISMNLAKNVRSANNGAAAGITETYAMITIDHLPSGTRTADYKVEVMSNGIVFFTGRKNTATLGMNKFEISRETMSALDLLFKESKFNQIYDELPMGMGGPKVITSFKSSASDKAITHVDYAGILPAALVEIRQKAEIILGISKLVDPWNTRGITEAANNSTEN
jgi:hypothetical protein